MPSTTEMLDRGGKIASGRVRGVNAISVFGERFSIPAFSETTFWDGPTNLYTYTDPAINRINRVSSSSASDTGQISISGLDENWLIIEQIVQLNGQNKVALSTPLIRFNSAISLKDLIGNVYIYEDTAITGGVPNDLNKVKGYIYFANNISKFFGYSVPSNCKALIKSINFYGIPSANCCLRLRQYVRNFGQALVKAYETPVVDGGSSFIDIVIRTTVPYPPKTDLSSRILTNLPGSGATAIAEIELVRL